MLAQYTENKGIGFGGLFDNLKVNMDSFKETIDAFKNSESFDEFIDLNTNRTNWDELSKSIGITDTRLRSYLETLDDGKGNIDNASASIEGMLAYLKKSGQMFNFAAIKATLLNTALNAGIMLAASVAIQAVVKGLDNFINRAKYAKEAMEEAQSAIDSAQNSLKEISATIEDNKDRFLELSTGVDKFSKNIKLSDEDYAEYLSISNKFAEISPELVSGYTDQGDALLYLGNNAEETNEKLNKILEAEQAIAQQALIDNMDSIAKGIYYEVDKANSDIANLEAELNTVSTVFRNIEGIIKPVDNEISSINFGTGSGLELDFDEMEQFKNAIRSSGAKITEDEVFDSMIFSSSETPLVQKAIENFYKQLDYTRKNEAAAYINGITKDIQEHENAIKDAYAKMVPNLVAWAKSTYEYDFLGEQQKELIESLIPTLDWNDIKEKTGMKLFSDDEYEQYIKENIFVPLMSIPDEYQDEVNKKFAKLLEFESGDINVVDFVSELLKYLDNIDVTIDIQPLIGDTEELKNSYEQITTDAARKFIEKSSKNYALLDNERQALDDFAKKNSINTRDEIAFWNQCLEESDTREQAMEKYLAASNSLNENPVSSFEEAWADSFTSESDAVKELGNTLLELAEQGRLTTETFNETDSTDYFKNLGISADEAASKINRLVDESKQLSSMSSQISAMANALGTKKEDGFVSADTLSGFDVEVRGLDSWDRFQEVLGSTASSYEDCEKAANALATEWVNSSDFLAQLTDENKEYYETQLKAMGVENYEEVIEHAQAFNEAK
ncbi:MAG: hypothetical protein HDR71_08935 [Lachnospiraceae bacterium]|nr:hypothetical protein [Lachnospiraceae bacterium]